MLKTHVLHPEILSALASAGHLGKVLISDGNFPHNTNPNPRAKIVWANFTPGLLDCATMMNIVAELVPIEAVEVMAPAKTGEFAMKNEPPVWADYRKILREKSEFKGELTQHSKVQFNEQARKEDVFLVIATGEVQLYANALITIGVVKPK
jgi:L-fucose mutarotase